MPAVGCPVRGGVMIPWYDDLAPWADLVVLGVPLAVFWFVVVRRGGR